MIKLILKEEKRDLFTVDNKYCLAHCISSDLAMGAGIAVKFQEKYNLSRRIRKNEKGKITYPNVYLIGNIFSLVTKELYWHKPTYENFKITLQMMKHMCGWNHIKYLAMPKLGCGLDRLSWVKVKEMIEEVFGDMDIEILVCHI